MKLLVSVASCAAIYSGAIAASEIAPSISLGGFIRADYGAGERYPEDRGEDRLGISKAALAVTAEHEDIKGVFVVGTERMTDGNPDNDGNVDIKDAFIVVGAGKEQGFWFSVGAQPLLFGLKPNGYPGDRSLQPSIEYSGAGGFAISNQAGPSLIGTYAFNPQMSLRFGAFDLDASNFPSVIPPNDGSSLSDNLFVQWRGADLFGTGLYATAGVEQLYVGGAVNDGQAIVSAGVGLKQGMFDASLELARLDAEIVGATDDEQYMIAEVAMQVNSEWTVYLDWANADELDATTYRLGANYQLRSHLTFSFEYSKDDFGTAGANDVDSVDLRLTFAY